MAAIPFELITVNFPRGILKRLADGEHVTVADIVYALAKERAQTVRTTASPAPRVEELQIRDDHTSHDLIKDWGTIMVAFWPDSAAYVKGYIAFLLKLHVTTSLAGSIVLDNLIRGHASRSGNPPWSAAQGSNFPLPLVLEIVQVLSAPANKRPSARCGVCYSSAHATGECHFRPLTTVNTWGAPIRPQYPEVAAKRVINPAADPEERVRTKDCHRWEKEEGCDRGVDCWYRHDPAKRGIREKRKKDVGKPSGMEDDKKGKRVYPTTKEPAPRRRR